MSRRVGALVLAACCAGAAAGVAWAAFSATTSNAGSSFAANRIYAGDRSIAAQDVRDASSGTEANASNPFAFVDAIVYTTAAAMTSGSNVYVRVDLDGSRPAGIAVTGMQLNVTLASQGGPGSGNGCAWATVVSGGSVIGTHGSYASPLGCSTGATQTTMTAALPEVTSTDQVNGLTIRLYAWETAAKKVKIDRVTVTGTDYRAFTGYPIVVTDNSSGPTVTTWAYAAADGTTDASASAWPSAAPGATKYLKLTFDPNVKAGSTITSVTFTHVWAAAASPGTGTQLCEYLEVYTGTTLLAAHGSAGSPFACTSATGAVTDTVSLPEVTTAAQVDSLVIKVYYWSDPLCGGRGNPACVTTLTDQGTLTVNSYWT